MISLNSYGPVHVYSIVFAFSVGYQLQVNVEM